MEPHKDQAHVKGLSCLLLLLSSMVFFDRLPSEKDRLDYPRQKK